MTISRSASLPGIVLIMGLSTDTKPVSVAGDSFIETNTGKVFYPDGASGWTQAAGGAAAWGDITGTLSNQTDLQTALNAKAATTAKLDSFGAPDDVTTLNASATAHGLMMKYPGGTTNFLRADGTFAAPPGGAGGTPANYLNLLAGI